MADKSAAIKPFVIDEAITQGAADRPDPFPVKLSAQDDEFYLKDPEQLDWQDAYLAAASESPFTVLSLIVPDEVADAFFEKEITVAAMKRLVEQWRDHYGIDENSYAEGGGALNRAQRRAKDRAKRKQK